MPLYLGIGGAAVAILVFFLFIFPLLQKGNVIDDPFDRPLNININTNENNNNNDNPTGNPTDVRNIEYVEGEAGFKTSDPNIKMIEVNQCLSYGFDTDSGEFYVIDNFVAGKETAVFIALEKPFDPDIEVMLSIERDDEPVASFSSYEQIDDNTLLFHPGDISEVGSWEQGVYTFTFTMGESIAKRTTIFHRSGPMKVLAVPMINNYSGEIRSCTGEWKNGITMITAVYPVARDDVEYVLGPEQDFSAPKYDINTESGQRMIWRVLSALQTPDNDYTMILAFMPIPAGNTLGYTYGGAVAISCESELDMQATVVHEIAHCYDIGDEYQGGHLNLDLNHPPYGMRGISIYDESPVAGIKEFVRSSRTVGLKGSGSLIYEQQRVYWHEGRLLMGARASYMSGGAGEDAFMFWTSSEIWNHLFNMLTGKQSGRDDDEVARTSGDGTPGQQITVLEIRGAFEAPGEFTADPWYSFIAGDSSLTSNDSGEYSAVVYDSNGQQLSVAYFDVTDNYRLTTEEGVLFGSSQGIPIRVITRYPETASKVVIYWGDRAIHTENLSENSPTVRFTCFTEGQALGNNVTLTWEADDADGDELTFQIWYYRALGDMYLVATDVKGNSLDVDLTKFPGSGRGWFGILATDGSRTGMSETPKISVPYNAPDILTYIPGNKQYIAGSPIIIQGRVKDPQDGWLLDGYEWYIGGRLVENNGKSHLRLEANTLAPGTYTVTIKVTNSAGISSSRDYTIVVVERRTND